MNSADDSLPRDYLGVAHDRMFAVGFNRKSCEIELAIKNVTENGQTKEDFRLGYRIRKELNANVLHEEGRLILFSEDVILEGPSVLHDNVDRNNTPPKVGWRRWATGKRCKEDDYVRCKAADNWNRGTGRFEEATKT